ncbi:3-(3-hydroxy-phenyl)propionate/3-hydroxycinnamic acid hydroxylase [Actinomadura rubteroloni]|uniref:3-(3-hydroxy-phenyl)propionate/3-hydroxycinnamic acid hydroxylase n=1 Tax=Actinomadura rubteroloni TaxID=1926885 RepID=A0A2P4UBW7_9ACTN|nr:FAD-dependent monooxygenase [Actinomadura rubteroloni]POM22539.1 3-(3-hydroxy-phenyl)propionate/3-hydroxycinnamic acid hydroxylase [Actinomadura rubteroloni]
MSTAVVIVGAGPVGLALACELGAAGVAATVLERRDGTDLRSPGMAINGAVVELLEQRGLLEPLRQYAMDLPAAHFSNLWLDLAPVLAEHPPSMIVPQWRIERHLEARARELGVTVVRGAEVTGLEQDDDAVTVTCNGGETLTASYVVGCDGPDSTVRRLAGIGFPLRDAKFYGLLGDIEADFADLLPEQVGASYSPVGGTYAGTPAEPGVWRINTAEWGVAPADPDAPVTLDELNDRVERLTGTRFKKATARWLVRTRNPTANADAYRSGRVFLAGDAAHVFFPFNGQRLSAGFHDASNLGWKLAAEIGGWAPDGLLDTYHGERHPVGRWICVNVQAQEALAAPPESAQPLRELFAALIALPDTNRFLAETVMGLGVRYPLGGEGAHPLVGRRLRVELEPGRGALLDFGGGVPDGALDGRRDRVDLVVREPLPGADVPAALVRPDGHVVWVAAEGGGDLAEALGRWFGPRR